MSAGSPRDRYIFRQGRRQVASAALLRALQCALSALGGSPSERLLISALLRAGELECAAADLDSPSAIALAEITDALAHALLGNRSSIPRLPDNVVLPERVTVATPEGFAYYNLHPRDFASLAASMPLAGEDAVVIGIRSIGTTLSAVVAAALRRRGKKAQRITVRPGGHPYDRKMNLQADELAWIASVAHVDFLVVDEGPGLSGSSFLSVGEALIEAGVAPQRIAFLCSHPPELEKLVAPDAARRWRSFRARCVDSSARRPDGAVIELSGGAWRNISYAREEQWPASWPTFERVKYLSGDKKSLFKFEGMGHFGDAVAERAALIADAGFGPRPQEASAGFLRYPFLAGRPMRAHDVSTSVLERLAAYCAFRVAAFPAPEADLEQLNIMLRHNFEQEFGDGLGARMVLERPVLADARMMPHEWRGTAKGKMLKTDAASHGDDHFFPGPVDIAWDLAGAIVEWELSPAAAEYFLDRYVQLSGDSPHARLPDYLVAYAVFRMAYSTMAVESCRGSDEFPRLWRDHERYRAMAERLDARHAAA